jgi:hypothetical protein
MFYTESRHKEKNMLEKRGDFKIGKSKTDDGTGKNAKIAPKKPWHLVRDNKDDKALNKKANVDQSSQDIDDFLNEANDA